MSCHVLHLLGTARPEGASIAQLVAALASRLDPEHYSISAWFLGGPGPLAATLQAAGAQVSVFDWREGIRQPGGAWQFLRALRRGSFAIVHQHFGDRSVRGLVRWGTRAALVRHLHGRVLESKSATPVPILVKRTDKLIAVSNAVARQVTSTVPWVVYPGVDIPNSKVPGSKSGTVLGVACRLVPIKGILYLLHAIAYLCENFPTIRLEIAGSGPERHALETEVELLGLRDSVDFLGWQSILSPSFSRWDIFVLPSLEEGLPIAALEAMAAGLPIVASAVGGVPELVENGRTGFLVPPGDCVALADSLRTLLLNRDLRVAMGAAAQDRARQHFSTDRMVEAVSKIYDDILDSC